MIYIQNSRVTPFPQKVLNQLHFREIYSYRDFLEKCRIFEAGQNDRMIELAKNELYSISILFSITRTSPKKIRIDFDFVPNLFFGI